MTIDDAAGLFERDFESYVKALTTFLSIPSLSARPEHADDMARCAAWLRDRLTAAGLEADVLPTAGHPVVVADSGPPEENPDAPTILLYGHYDVQPPGDETLWHTSPFEPTVRDGAVFARGSADNKGQLMTHLAALASLHDAGRRPPVRVKCLYEGEEEVGSPNLPDFVCAQADRLACDAVLVTDASRLSGGRPALFYASRGLVYKEITLEGPPHDLHSGHYGGAVGNPANLMARIVASLQDDAGRVRIPGFYKDVRRLTAVQRRWLGETAPSDAELIEETGVPALWGESRYSSAQRCTARPTLDVNGWLAGYTGAGAATIIPARASAKVSMRLVPDQDPRAVSDAFDAAVRAACPPAVRASVRTLSTCAAYQSPTDSPFLRAAAAALATAYGVRPALAREGGTWPILPMFKQVLGADSVVTGFADPHANAHGPNEFFSLDDLKRGTRTVLAFLDHCATPSAMK